MTYEELMNNSIYLQTKTTSTNDLGEPIYTWTTSSTPVSCRLNTLSAMERIDTTGRYKDVKYKCYCLSSASISVDNRAVYGGESYRVKEVYSDSSFHHKTALLVQVP